LTKVSLHKDYVLVETDDIDLSELRAGKITMTYYIVEIHDTENDHIGVLTEKGSELPQKFSSFSQAKIQSALLKQQLTENMSTKIVSFEEEYSNE